MRDTFISLSFYTCLILLKGYSKYTEQFEQFYFIQNPEGRLPKWEHKHINTWWLIHTKHTQGNKIGNTDVKKQIESILKVVSQCDYFCKIEFAQTMNHERVKCSIKIHTESNTPRIRY